MYIFKDRIKIKPAHTTRINFIRNPVIGHDVAIGEFSTQLYCIDDIFDANALVQLSSVCFCVIDGYHYVNLFKYVRYLQNMTSLKKMLMNTRNKNNIITQIEIHIHTLNEILNRIVDGITAPKKRYCRLFCDQSSVINIDTWAISLFEDIAEHIQKQLYVLATRVHIHLDICYDCPTIFPNGDHTVPYGERPVQFYQNNNEYNPFDMISTDLDIVKLWKYCPSTHNPLVNIRFISQIVERQSTEKIFSFSGSICTLTNEERKALLMCCLYTINELSAPPYIDLVTLQRLKSLNLIDISSSGVPSAMVSHRDDIDHMINILKSTDDTITVTDDTITDPITDDELMTIIIKESKAKRCVDVSALQGTYLKGPAVGTETKIRNAFYDVRTRKTKKCMLFCDVVQKINDKELRLRDYLLFLSVHGVSSSNQLIVTLSNK